MTPIDEPGMVFELFERPDEGWTRSFGFSTEDVSYEDCLSEEFYELEREAVFRRSWLMIGLESQLPRKGSYVTRELPVLGTSLLVTRGEGKTVRAFHNMCSHRGNKLVWTDDSSAETCGTTRQFMCKYHGWRFGLEGQLTHVNTPQWFFDLDACRYGLTPVRCDTWNGFIFVNLAPEPKETLRQQLGEIGTSLEGYPFDTLTQVYTVRAEARANWKLWLDAFQESYHGGTVHAKLLDANAEGSLPFNTGSHFEFHERNALWSVAMPFDLESLKLLRPLRPTEAVMESIFFGPWYRPDLGITELPKLVNPTRHPNWTSDMYFFSPNFHLVHWSQNWATAFTFWPLAHDRLVAEARFMFVPPQNASQRLAQELAATESQEAMLQDVSTLEPTYAMLRSRAKTHFPLGDEEVQLRFHRNVIHQLVDDYQAEREAGR